MVKGQKSQDKVMQDKRKDGESRGKKGIRRFVFAGSILVIVMLLAIAYMAHARPADGSRETDESAVVAGETGDISESGEEAEAAETGEIVIGLKGSAVQPVLEGEPYIENGAFATDTENGAIPEGEIAISGSVDTSVPGDYTVRYTARSESREASAERTVRVMTEEEYGDRARNVPVMMYHWVYTADDVPEELNVNWILDTDLEEQLKWLSENEFYYPGWKELRAWVDDEISMPAKCAVLTFDDGKEAFLKYGVPLMEKYRIPATSFMIGWKKNKGAKKIREYASPYIDYESHTYAMHQKNEPFVNGHIGIMATMSREEIKADLTKAAEMTGSYDAMAYPYGDYNTEMVEAVRELGIGCAFTVDYDRVRKGMDPARLPRIRVVGDAGFETWKASIY